MLSSSVHLMVLITVPVALACLAQAEAHVAVFQDGTHGYDGTRDTFISSHYAHANSGAANSIIVRKTPSRPSRQVGLIKFTGLTIPAGSRIVSAHLNLYCSEMGEGKSLTVAAHGLLKDFMEGTGYWGPVQLPPAEPGETTWNWLHHPKTPWGAPGAGSMTAESDYDADRDCLSPADDQVLVIKSGAWCVWDVTRSFADQFAHGKEYGWALKPVSNDDHDRVVAFFGRVWPADDAPRSIRPKLVVTYEPAKAQPAPAPMPYAKLLLRTGHPVEKFLAESERERLPEFPFDGVIWRACVIGAEPFRAQKLPGAKHYASFIAGVRATLMPRSRMTDHFLDFTLTTPGTLDPKADPKDPDARVWFGDFDSVIHNIRVLAEIAKRAGMKGLEMNWEPYTRKNMWRYENQADARELGKTLTQTQQQVRECGRRFVAAINEVYPDMSLIIIPRLYGGPYGSKWELINPFLDGIVAAADPRMRLVDGNEHAYYALSLGDFRRMYAQTYAAGPSDPALREKYLRQVSVGFGVWLEKNAWSEDPERDSISAARWQVRLEDALITADSYVWVFNGGRAHGPDWWTGARLPQAYLDATQQARHLTRDQQ